MLQHLGAFVNMVDDKLTWPYFPTTVLSQRPFTKKETWLRPRSMFLSLEIKEKIVDGFN